MLKLYNTLSKGLEQVNPIEPGLVKMYTCGPTVYRDAHIGNLRSYLMADWVRRTLEVQGISVTHVKNITDVGHMRQDMLERGEDKVVASAIAEGKSPREIAEFYTRCFLRDEKKLNIIPASHFPRATDHISEVLEILGSLIRKGYAYEVQGNVYFQVSTFPSYGRLSGNIRENVLLEAVRNEVDPLKRDPRDFTLWKRAEPGRELAWPSPWGDGFPGWHIECSAMSIKYLGRRFDLHTGGVDNIFPHHEDEKAQSEGFTGDGVVNFWVHGQHLLADGVKMAKSSSNSFVLADIEAQGIEPLAFRYLCLTARYTSRLNFTFNSLKAAQRSLIRLRNSVSRWNGLPQQETLGGGVVEESKIRFMDRVNDNLDLPGALALTWAIVKSQFPEEIKKQILWEYDKVLGLDLYGCFDENGLSMEVRNLIDRRSTLRKSGKYEEADFVRSELEDLGYVVEDSLVNTMVRPKTNWELREEQWPTVSSPADVSSMVEKTDDADFTIGVVACNYLDDVKRCLVSSLRWVGNRQVEVVVVDNGSTDGTGEWLEQYSSLDSRIRVIHTDHILGCGAAKNIVLKQSVGEVLVLIDTSVEVIGDFFGPIEDLLSDDSIGVVGPYGLRTDDLHHFHDGEGESGEMDAIQAYCFAYRRCRIKQVGLMRESFRYYRNLDLDYSFHFKDKGFKVVANPEIPVKRHTHRAWSELSGDEREKLSHKNYRRFLEKWGQRRDLLVCARNENLVVST